MQTNKKKLPSEPSITEMIHLKGIGREAAIKKLQNPTPHKTAEEKSQEIFDKHKKGK